MLVSFARKSCSSLVLVLERTRTTTTLHGDLAFQPENIVGGYRAVKAFGC
jgi:hypothetical protein